LPVEADVVEATLVVDSRRIERYLGTRSFAVAERQLVFRGGGAYVELRVPPADAAGSDWLHGQYLARRDEDLLGPNRVSVRVLPPHGDGQTVAVGATGDFAVPFGGKAVGTVSVEFRVRDAATLMLRFEP
jgi:hypothetical protein